VTELTATRTNLLSDRATKRRWSGKSVARYAVTYLLLIAIFLVVVTPLSWIAVSSFTTRETVWKNVLPFSWRAFFPQDFTLDSYRQIFEAGFGRTMITTFMLGIVTVILSIIVGSLAGFAFARF
jgi:ABC-type glycerol-3-phosphate transport system permease component